LDIFQNHYVAAPKVSQYQNIKKLSPNACYHAAKSQVGEGLRRMYGAEPEPSKEVSTVQLLREQRLAHAL
jgi:hypothetical protein